MNSHEQFQIVQTMLGIGLLFIGYTFMYVRTRLDNFREDIFSLRDELFDYMWKNELSFSMPAYSVLRNALNGNIRFARKTWLFALWVTAFLSRNEGISLAGEQYPNIHDEIEKIADPKIRWYFRSVYHRMGSRVLDYIFLEGLLWPFARLLKIYLRRRGIADAQRRMGFPMMAEEAAQLGKPDSREAKHLLSF